MHIEFKKWAVFLINITNAVLWIMIIFCTFIWLENFSLNSWLDSNQTHSSLPPLIGVAALLLIREPLYQMKQIIYNLMDDEVFTQENINRFKRISYPLFILAIGSFFAPFAYIQLEFNGGYFRVESFILIILGFLSILISHIFSHAMQIQMESLQLKEETKLTI